MKTNIRRFFIPIILCIFTLMSCVKKLDRTEFSYIVNEYETGATEYVVKNQPLSIDSFLHKLSIQNREIDTVLKEFRKVRKDYSNNLGYWENLKR